jgi:hypothetical protein
MEMLTVLMMGWTAQSGEVMHVDTIGVPDATLEALEKKHGEKILPVAHPDVPARLKLPTWTLITTTGATVVPVTGVKFVRGAGENHAFFVLKPAKVVGEGLAIAKALTHSPKLVPIEPKTTDPKILKFVNVAWPKARSKAMSAEMRRAVPRRLKAKHVTVVSGRFGTPNFRYVYVSIPMSKAGKAPMVAGYVTAVGKLDSTGAITWMVAPRRGLSTLTPRYTVDSDGDGQDEVVHDDHYYEGTYTFLLHPDGRQVPLGGDGA